MFKNLTSKFTHLIRSFSDKYKLSESELDIIIKKIRKILLDSDISLNTVKYLILNIKNKLTTLEVSRKISPSQIIVKSIYDEFTDIMGGLNSPRFKFNINELNVILFTGLQGVGKTTSIAKFAHWLKKKYKKKVLLSSCDIYRPGAIEQLKFLANKNNIDFFDQNLLDITIILKTALNYAQVNSYDFLLVDSAGRLHLDENMMNELSFIDSILKPSYTFLILDSTYGQDAINSSSVFINKFKISGFIVTKMDSDTKGGIILSLTYNTKKPVYFIGTGENINDLDLFYPDRLASRILGMGDIDTLIDEVKEKLTIKDQLIEKSFDMNLFKEQINNLLKLGGFKKIVEKLPSYNFGEINESKLDNDFLKKMLSIIDSMTIKERKYPSILNFSRKKRLWKGSGCKLHDINKLIKYYEKFSKFLSKENYQSSISSKLKNKSFL